MKHSFLGLMVILASSCGNPTKVDKKPNPGQAEQPDIQSKSDTEWTSLQTSKFPLWLKELYPDTVKEGRTPPYEEAQSLMAFAQLNDSVTYCIYEVNTNGIAYHYVLATQLWKKPLQEENVGASDEHAEYEQVRESSTYEVLSTDTILVTEYTEFVPDSIISKKGTLEDGAIYEPEDWVVVTKKRKLKVLNTGAIQEILN